MCSAGDDFLLGGFSRVWTRYISQYPHLRPADLVSICNTNKVVVEDTYEEHFVRASFFSFGAEKYSVSMRLFSALVASLMVGVVSVPAASAEDAGTETLASPSASPSLTVEVPADEIAPTPSPTVEPSPSVEEESSESTPPPVRVATRSDESFEFRPFLNTDVRVSGSSEVSSFGEFGVVESTTDATISGTVTVHAGSAATEVCVYAYELPDYNEFFDCAPVSAGSPGAYSIPVMAGDYIVLFETDDPGTATEWYGDTPSYEKATQITVASAATFTADKTLGDAGTITGTMILVNGLSAPLDSVAEIYQTDGDFVRIAFVDDSGAFSAPHLPPGSYHVFFASTAGDGQWYDGSCCSEFASDVIVTAGSTTDASTSTLPHRPYFKGKVSLPSGAVMDGQVYAYRKSDNDETIVYPRADGTFEIYVDSGKYRIQFWGFEGAAQEFYDNAKLWPDAKWISPSSGGKSLGTVKLARSGVFEGNLSYGLPGQEVCASAYSVPEGWGVGSYCDTSGEPFTIDYLSAGKYKIILESENGWQRWLDHGGHWGEATKLSVSAGQTVWLQVEDTRISYSTARGGSGYVKGEKVSFSIDTNNLYTGDATVQFKRPGMSSWETLKKVAVVDGTGSFVDVPRERIRYRVKVGPIGGSAETGSFNQVAPSSVVLSGPGSYTSGDVFDVDVSLGEPGNGKGKLQVSVNGGKWSTVDGGISIVDGVGSRSLSRKTGDSVRYRVSFGRVTSNEVTITREYRAWANSGGGDFFKGTTHEITFDVTPEFSGTTKLWIKKGSNSWAKTKTTVTFVDGVATLDVTPPAKLTQYQVRLGADKSDPIVFTRVNPVITLGGAGDFEQGAPFDLDVTIVGPDGSDVPEYSGNVKLQIRKPGGTWSTVSGGIDVVDGTGSVTLTQTKAKREYRVLFAGKKSNVIVVTTYVPPAE